MDVPSVSPDDLRARARHLDDLAQRLEAATARSVGQLAGDTTWRGGLAHLCRDDLGQVSATLDAVIGSLRNEADVCRRTAMAVEYLPR